VAEKASPFVISSTTLCPMIDDLLSPPNAVTSWDRSGRPALPMNRPSQSGRISWTEKPNETIPRK
jgi:hypothetical protein